MISEFSKMRRAEKRKADSEANKIWHAIMYPKKFKKK